MTQPIQQWEVAATSGQCFRVEIRGAAPEKAVAILEWCDGHEENSTQRVPGAFYRAFLTRAEKGWHGVFTAPPETKSLRVLVEHWTHLGAPETGDYECECHEVEASAPREIRVAVAHNRAPQNATIESNIALMCEAIGEAGKQKVQLLCLTENFPDRTVNAPLADRALTPDDERLQPLFDAIRAANLYAVFTLHERTPQGVFIAAWLVSPQGEIIGRYNKCNLTLSELEAGLSPGHEVSVFDTPIGKIGILICWDAWFPESATELAKRGVEIVCFPLAGDGAPAHYEHVWRARALDNQVFWLASATDNCSPMPSRIIAPDGSVLAETKTPNTIITADINLNARVETYWLSVGPYLSQNAQCLRTTLVCRGKRAALKTKINCQNS